MKAIFKLQRFSIELTGLRSEVPEGPSLQGEKLESGNQSRSHLTNVLQYLPICGDVASPSRLS